MLGSESVSLDAIAAATPDFTASTARSDVRRAMFAVHTPEQGAISQRYVACKATRPEWLQPQPLTSEQAAVEALLQAPIPSDPPHSVPCPLTRATVGGPGSPCCPTLSGGISPPDCYDTIPACPSRSLDSAVRLRLNEPAKAVEAVPAVSMSAPVAVEAGAARALGAAAARADSVLRLQPGAPPPRSHLDAGEGNAGEGCAFPETEAEHRAAVNAGRIFISSLETEAEHRAAVAIQRRVRGYLSRRENKVSAVRAVAAFSRLVSPSVSITTSTRISRLHCLHAIEL